MPFEPPVESPAASTVESLAHLAWVWQFNQDGSKELIRDVLAAHGLGVVLKTNDGVDWMAEFDDSVDAVDGPGQVAELAAFFEEGGVPFHAWSVLNGFDPLQEARMTADVLAAGARTITLDVEPHAQFWQGDAAGAAAFGRELRLLQPSSWVAISIDPRPWEISRIPLGEFSSFASEISPQIYWNAFETWQNVVKFAAAGYQLGSAGMTPRFVLDAALDVLEPFGLPVHPIGEGEVSVTSEWGEFIDHSFANAADSVSVWRFGVTEPAVWEVLRANPPRPATYVVQPGDSLAVLAARWRVTVQALADANDIANPNLIQAGMQLRLPGRGTAALPPLTYEVQPGDSLSVLAERFDVAQSAIVELNGITDPNFVSVGQQLQIPRGGRGSAIAQPLFYKVEPGDSLTAIAWRFDTSIDAIVTLNDLFSANQIFIGQQLRVR
ncbi:MAG: LysM peptidoglycan-binding domain-containing protein [Dehalococcoidia bacterium]|nr:LysM peptidoglycan-binding domain-containing protein [Dehalococcoidia bacterium]